MSSIKAANLAFHQKKYKEAINLYQAAIAENPDLDNFIKINIELAKRRLGIGDKVLDNTGEANLNKKNLVSSSYRHKLEKSDITTICGWCVNQKKPNDIFDVDVFLDGQFYLKVKNDVRRLDLKKHGISEGFGGFEFTNPAIYLEEGQHTISIRLPDGSVSENMLVESKGYLKQVNISENFPERGVTIIVPIYNAPDDVAACIQRLLAYTPSFAKILLIDDCSPDQRIAAILAEHTSTESIRILRNPENLGFTRTVNRGIDEAGNDDVVLLNSDARVTPGWLEGMLLAASSAPRIATVTAMSDRAGAFSAPDMGNDNKLPEGVDEITYARAFRRRSLGLYPRVPTGNGFCMYVSRECINSIGALDAQAFPRGYGEENDFCMRAWRAGWHNVIDDRTYVFHDRSKSFGESKVELMKAGRAVVDARYPEYKNAIRVFSTSEEIALARNRARLAMQDCLDMRWRGWIPRVLFVIATQTGGTPQTNRDLIQALSGVFEGWTLRCNSKMLELCLIHDDGKSTIIRSHKLVEQVDPLTHNSAEYDSIVSAWLKEFNFELLHIRHLGWHGLSLPRIARNLGQKVVFSFHDFYAISPTIKLIDDKGIFLGENFFDSGSVYRESIWKSDALPKPEGTWLKFWQERFQASLSYCDAFVTTSDSARKLILDALPKLPADRFVVIPHGRDFPTFEKIRKKPKKGKPLRILVPGNINPSKGLSIINGLIDIDKDEILEFHILGKVTGEKPKKGLFLHGAYLRNEFADKARAIEPHIGIVFSIWDETYCHTLTELWSIGLPVAVFNYPNLADRVNRCGAGWVLDQKNIPELYKELKRLAFDDSEYERTNHALDCWQSGYGLANSSAQMAAGYLNIYSDVILIGSTKRKKLSSYNRKRIGVLCPSSIDLLKAPGSTHIRIWERIHNSIERPITYIKMSFTTLIASVKERMIDAVIIQRNAVPLDMVEFIINLLASTNIPYLFDLDDNLLNVPKDKDVGGKYAAYIPALESLIKSASMITVSTPYLQDKLNSKNSNVRILPNYLSDRLWRVPLKPRIKDGIVRALYMGTLTHNEDFELILPALDEVSKIIPNFRVTLIGVTQKKDLIDRRPWIEVINAPSKDYVDFVEWIFSISNKFDFAIAPLCDTAFNSYKSDLKLLDYGALGLPVIASDVNVFNQTKVPEVFLVKNEFSDWIEALKNCISLLGQDKDFGRKIHKWVLDNRMLSKTLKAYDDLLIDLIHEQRY